MYNERIRVGTIVDAHVRMGVVEYVTSIVPHGFESIQITFGGSAAGIDLRRLAGKVQEALAGSGAVVSCLGIYGNPLGKDAAAKDARQSWRRLIDNVHLFNSDLVCGFAGGVPDRPIDQNIRPFARCFGPLQKRAADKGVRIAFENCSMGGTWHSPRKNIALDPTAWELMFNAVPSDNLGLEWEPCHQMVKLIDPMPQLRRWAGKVFHVHGKDATVMWDVIREYGIQGPKRFACHRTPGFGDSNWADIISILRMGGFEGSIDIEGWHDPVYRGELEMMGQVRGLEYLKACRGGAFVPYPPVHGGRRKAR
jgi:sugar phosphate isomerase/epimerase